MPASIELPGTPNTRQTSHTPPLNEHENIGMPVGAEAPLSHIRVVERTRMK